jgi:hypothetical protein
MTGLGQLTKAKSQAKKAKGASLGTDLETGLEVSHWAGLVTVMEADMEAGLEASH